MRRDSNIRRDLEQHVALAAVAPRSGRRTPEHACADCAAGVPHSRCHYEDLGEVDNHRQPN